MPLPRFFALLFSAVVAIVASLSAVPLDPVEVAPAAVDAIFSPWDRSDSPGCALAVVHDGRMLYERGYGMADLEHGIPITPATVFYVGSDSKQFAAAAIALLVRRGELSLDDEVRKYVPELPDFGATITIGHLVYHTSGLRDYLDLRALAGEPADSVFGDADLLALLGRQRELNFAPGSQYLYSNSGYFLLSIIVQRASGKTLREFAAANIFEPLGMATAQFRDDHTALVPNRASGYAARHDGYRLSLPNFDVVGAGGLFMSVRDALPWLRNFEHPRVGDPAFIALLETSGRLNDGSDCGYAFGLKVGRYRGRPIIEHGGAYGGYRAHLLRFPEQRFSIACFANLASMKPGELARRVADLYLAAVLGAPDELAAGEKAEIAAASPHSARLAPVLATPELELRAWAGEYFSEELQTSFQIEASRADLFVRGGRRERRRLQPLATDRFAAGSWTLTFYRNTDEQIAGFALDTGRVRHLRFVRR